MTPVSRRALKIDVRVDSGRWKAVTDARTIVRHAVTEAAAALSTAGAELAIVLTDDSAIRSLNCHWRGIDAATNVLSFPVKDAHGMSPLIMPPFIGDIVLAYETIAREASGEGKPFAHHLVHLTVHGFLHLLGYDHESSRDAAQMEEAECQILRRLAIPDPYRRPANATTVPRRKGRTRSQNRARRAKLRQ
jgi:probable rRNA maturation factor